MPHIFVNDLKPGIKVNQYFLIKKKERRRTRGGKDYLDIILADRTGNLGAKSGAKSLEQMDPLFEAGQFAGKAGKADSYQDERQLTIQRIKGTHLIPLVTVGLPFQAALVRPPKAYKNLFGISIRLILQG